MIAMRMKRNVLDQDEFVIAGDFLEGPAEFFRRILVVSGEHLAIGLGDALRRIAQALALDVVAGPAQKDPDRILDLGQRGTLGRLWFRARRAVGRGRKVLDDGVHEGVSRSPFRRRDELNGLLPHCGNWICRVQARNRRAAFGLGGLKSQTLPRPEPEHYI